MKSIRLLSLVSLLVGSALIGIAGQTSQLFRPGDQLPATTRATALKCAACKDESLRVTRLVGPANHQQVQSVEVARRHSCDACGSAVTAAHDCGNEKTPGASCCAGRS